MMKKTKKGLEQSQPISMTNEELGSLEAILIPKSTVKDRHEAIEKARKYGQMHIVEELVNFYRCRRGRTNHPSYHTKTLPNGVQLVYGREKDGSGKDRRGTEEAGESS